MSSRLHLDRAGVQAAVEVCLSMAVSAFAVANFVLRGPPAWHYALGLAFLFANILRALLGILESSLPSGRQHLTLFHGLFLSVLMSGGYLWHSGLLLLSLAGSSLPDSPPDSSTQRLAEVVLAISSTLYSCGWLAVYRSLARSAASAMGDEEATAKPEVTSFRFEGVDGAEAPSCVICLEEFERECRVGRLQCGHLFHADCIRAWLLRGHKSARCPMRCSAVGKTSPIPSPAEESGGETGVVEMELQV